jgi:hypothetical protein
MEPIKIIVAAETVEAVKELQQIPQVVERMATSLKQSSTAAAPVAKVLKDVAGNSANTRLAMMELGHVARATAEGLAAGISPMRMLAMEGPRIAQAASMSGIALGTMVPIVGALALAVGGGVLVWREYTSASREAEKAAKDLHEQLEGLAKIYAQLHEQQKAGLLSPEAVRKNLDLLTGKTSLYKDREGNFTTSPTSNIQLPKRQVISGGPVMPYEDPFEKPKFAVVPNEKANAQEIQKYILDNITVQGKLDESQIEARNKLKDLREKIHTESLTAAEQEKEAIHLKYQAERDEIDALAVSMGALLTPKKETENKAAKELSLQNEQAEKEAVDFKARESERQAASAAAAQSNQYYAQIVAQANKKLNADLDASAADQGRTREQIYQEEFAKRMSMLTSQLYASEIDEQQYTEAAKEAATKRLAAAEKEANAIKAIRKELELAGADRFKREELQINQKYDAEIDAVKKLNIGLKEQLKLINDINAARNADVAKVQAEAEHEKATSVIKYKSIWSAFEDMMHKRAGMTKQQKEDEDQINAEREQAVYTMFGNMATAAKIYGETGLEIYKGFAVAQAVMDTAKAAIGAYSSVVGIPYLGPVLAPIAAAAAVAAGVAQISAIESASAREHGGPVEAGMPYVVGERGQELFIPNSNGRIVNAADTSRMLTEKRDRGQSTTVKTQIHFWDDPRRMEKHIQDNPNIHHTIVDVMHRNIHRLRPPS